LIGLIAKGYELATMQHDRCLDHNRSDNHPPFRPNQGISFRLFHESIASYVTNTSRTAKMSRNCGPATVTTLMSF